MARIDPETLKATIRDHAETICRHYLPDGKRINNQWVVGNINGEPGQSLRIELEGEKAGLAYDFATGEGCDLLEIIKRKTGLRFIEVAREISKITAVNVEEPATQYHTAGRKGPRYQTSSSLRPFEWDKSYRLSPAHIDEACLWRGYRRPFVIWADERRYLGCSKKGNWAFPVCDENGKIIAAHIRHDKDKWEYLPRLQDLGIKLSPLVIGDLTTAEKVFIDESQWDVFSALDKLGIQYGEPIAGVATRSASTAALAAHIQTKGELYAIAQNDDPGRKWLETLSTVLPKEFKVITVPANFHDLNDWLKALGNDVKEFVEAIKNAEIRRPTPKQQRVYIEFHRPSYYLAYTPPPDLVLLGDCHIVRGQSFVIGGPPGVGKSRASVALGLAGALRVQWFGLETLVSFRTLIIQSENGRFRLKKELAEINEPKLEDHLMICPPPPYGLCFSRSEFRDQLQRYHDEFGPQLVLLDPWNAIAHDDRMRDYRESFDVVAEVFRLGDEKAPAIGILAHTRKPLPGERANGRALLNLLAGSYVLGSIPRCVFILQSASDSTLENRVVLTCCKNNEGNLGPRSVWERRNGLFAPVKDFDWHAWDHPEERSSRRPHPQGKIADLLALIPIEEPIRREELYAKAAGLVARDDIQGFLGELLREAKIFLHKIPNPLTNRSLIGYAQKPPSPQQTNAEPDTEFGIGDDPDADLDNDIEDDPRQENIRT
jgi:AAA domain